MKAPVQLARPHNFPERGGPGKSKLPQAPFFRHVVRQIGSKAMRLFTDLQTNHPET